MVCLTRGSRLKKNGLTFQLCRFCNNFTQAEQIKMQRQLERIHSILRLINLKDNYGISPCVCKPICCHSGSLFLFFNLSHEGKIRKPEQHLCAM